MKQHILLLATGLSLCAPAAAQEPVKGEVQLGAGTGTAAPWNAGIKLQFQTSKLTVKPFVSLTGINKDSSTQLEDISYRYSSSGNAYLSSRETSEKGSLLNYGVETSYQIDQQNTLTASIKAQRKHAETTGFWTETLITDATQSRWNYQTDLNIPTHNTDKLNAEAAWVHKTQLQGEEWALRYSFDQDKFDHDRRMTYGIVAEDRKTTLNELLTHANTQHHKLMLDWKRPLAQGQLLAMGARYENRSIKSEESQIIGLTSRWEETFSHHMQVGAAYAGYTLNQKAITLNARVEFDYTRMGEKNLTDLIPTFMFQWRMNQSQSLQANYVRRIIRPTLEYLSPAHIEGLFTLDYGNKALTGTHVNSYSLAYNVKKEKVNFSTTLNHILANDGFNAIWMEKENIRISTWGNEGMRRAWSVTPAIDWKPAAGTAIGAKAIILWDKRIAEAIHMAKEHWGITTQLNLAQYLGAGINLKMAGEYAEGNTIDLYSHGSSSFSFNGGLERNFGKALTASLNYGFKDYGKIILTQGAYTGTVYSRPMHHHAASVSLVFHL